MMKHYIYDFNEKRIYRATLTVWGEWFHQNLTRRHIPDGDTVIGNTRVSTVFVGLQSMWETMTFPDLDCDRCNGGEEQAIEMHKRMCEKVKARKDKNE